ncbi:hypothetical protein PPL_03541 [Heterostelium album PN500]|uniref:Pesticidal crystal protein N-terminal domain-containing protein n=1 Tax=Heterostelium pallidum (strain ATCC 26659 / Pp 5 / PN500) TaxID=670386 RepID=D3B531_HETP5|nr:hypothetical protein PPL_03541 [Heterostelium album PN500]EFA83396.1 hypothetical protein PPL_03541 [Heterostelium album PN500]|eukprot:XP_020435513.1 hypothetical protein PPL_03541 [Heterostelium album PN500]
MDRDTNTNNSECSEYKSKLKQFIAKQSEQLKQLFPDFKGFAEEETKMLEDSFKKSYDNPEIKSIDDWPLIEMALILANVFSFHPAGGPFTAAFNILFSALGLFSKGEDIMKEIMEKLEKYVDQRIGEFARNQSLLRFQALQTTGDRYFRLSQQWYDNNSVQTTLDQSKKVIFEDDGFNMPLSALEIVYFDYLRDLETALVFFGGDDYLAYTIPFYYLTGGLYISLQRDVIFKGKEMGFDPSYIDGTPNTKSLKVLLHEKIEQMMAISHKGVYPFQVLMGWGGLFNFPPYFDTAMGFINGDLVLYPNGVTVLHPNSNHEIEFPDAKGVYKFGGFPDQYRYGSVYNANRSLRSGVWGLTCNLNIIDISISFKLNCKTNHSRRFKIRVYHMIKGKASFSLINSNGGQGEQLMEWTTPSTKALLYQYLEGENEGYNESQVFIVPNFKNMIIRLNRKPNVGYTNKSYFGGIEFIDE